MAHADIKSTWDPRKRSILRPLLFQISSYVHVWLCYNDGSSSLIVSVWNLCIPYCCAPLLHIVDRFTRTCSSIERSRYGIQIVAAGMFADQQKLSSSWTTEWPHTQQHLPYSTMLPAMSPQRPQDSDRSCRCEGDTGGIFPSTKPCPRVGRLR